MADEIWDVRVKYEPPDVEYDQDSSSFQENMSEDDPKSVTEASADDSRSLTPGKTNAYTIRSTKASVKLFRDFLADKGESVEFEHYSKSELCSVLRTFYVEARKKNGDFYTTSSLNAMRFGINRHLQSVRRNIDILTDLEFCDANRAYRTQIAELKKRGKAEINRRQHFSMVDLLKLYFSPVFDTNSPEGLLRKVFFDVLHMLYRRPTCDGSMNLRELKRDRFVFGTLGGRKCAFPKAKSEEDAPIPGKNVMFEIAGHPRCPVASFEKYLSKMNPHNPWLWQKPKKAVEEDEEVWYEAVSVGHNTLGEMMATISKAAKLSFVYTNQCIRITPISLLETILKDTMPATTSQQQNSLGAIQDNVTSATDSIPTSKNQISTNNFLSATSAVSTTTQKTNLVMTRPTMVSTLPPLLPKTSQASKTASPLNSVLPGSSNAIQGHKAIGSSLQATANSDLVNSTSADANSNMAVLAATAQHLRNETTSGQQNTAVRSLSNTLAASVQVHSSSIDTNASRVLPVQGSPMKQSFTVMPQTSTASSQPLVVMGGDQNKTFALVQVESGTTTQTKLGNVMMKPNTGFPGSVGKSPLTVRAFDTANGVPAKSLHVQLFTQDSSCSTWKLLASGITNNEGRVTQLLTKEQFLPGRYLMRFDTEAYFMANSIDNFFYPRVEVEFVIKNTSQPCHIPLYLSPFSYSTYKESN